jgi:hypothetical protein
MSTPPTPPPPELAPAKKSRSNLAKLAIAFAVTILVTFGLCSITLISSNSAMNGPVFPAAIVIEAICIVGLIVVAILAIARRNS